MNIAKYLNIHSQGYVIKTLYPDNNHFQIKTTVFGNAQTLPNEIKMSAHHLFDIASLTKFFTAIIVHKTIEKGSLSLDTYIKDIDPRFIYLNDIKIIDLLSHKQEIWTDGYLGSADNKDEFYQMLFRAKVKKRKRTYVDAHYIILSILLEQIYQLSYDEIVKKEIIDVLNLKNTNFGCNNDNMAVSNNFENVDGKISDDIYPGIIHDKKARTAYDLGLFVGHAGIFTCADDLFEVLKALIDGENRLLSGASIERMLKADDLDTDLYNLLITLAQEKHIDVPNDNTDLNAIYELINQRINDPDLPYQIFRYYNYSGTRFKHPITVKNDIPLKASKKSIFFSGYTGPCFLIDFEKKIIILVMSNVCHTNVLTRDQRYKMTIKLINDLYNDILEKNN